MTRRKRNKTIRSKEDSNHNAGHNFPALQDIRQNTDINFWRSLSGGFRMAASAFLNICCFLFILLSPVKASALEPWHFMFSLTGKLSGTPMILPSSLYIDTERQRYYVTDTGNNRLLSFDLEGKLLNAFNAENKLSRPSDMVRDTAGILWVSEKKEHGSLTSINLEKREVRVHTIKKDGRQVIPGRLEFSGDRLFLLDRHDGELLALDKNLKILTRFSCGQCPYGFTDFKVSKNSVYALAALEKKIVCFNLEGKIISEITLQNEVIYPCSFDIDDTGRFFVLDRHGRHIGVFNSEGRFKYRFLMPGQNPGQLYHPTELRFDSWGRLCVVDEGNSRVEIYGRQ